MTKGWRLTNEARTLTIEPIYALNVNCRTFLKHFKILRFLIIRLIYTRDGAIRRVDAEAQDEMLLIVIIGGAIKRTPWTARMSWMLNPLSAITISPSTRWSKNPDFLIIFLSLIDPLYTCETKLKWHIGDCDTSTLNVLDGLYWLVLTVCVALGSWLRGRINAKFSATESIITQRLFNFW